MTSFALEQECRVGTFFCGCSLLSSPLPLSTSTVLRKRSKKKKKDSNQSVSDCEKSHTKASVLSSCRHKVCSQCVQNNNEGKIVCWCKRESCEEFWAQHSDIMSHKLDQAVFLKALKEKRQEKEEEDEKQKCGNFEDCGQMASHFCQSLIPFQPQKI